jgi:hypothetical protein
MVPSMTADGGDRDARTIAEAIAFLDDAVAKTDLTHRDLRKVRRVRTMLTKELTELAFGSVVARYAPSRRKESAEP